MGKTEPENLYVKIFHSSVETLIIANRKGALCCSKTLVDADKSNPTKKEIKNEVDKLAASRLSNRVTPNVLVTSQRISCSRHI